MKKWSKLIIIFLLITNSIFIATTLMYKNTSTNNTVYKIYSFQGESDDIRLSDGVIVISPLNQLVKGGKIQYLGQKKEHITAYTKTIYEDHQGTIEAIVTTSVSEVGATNGMTFPDELLLNQSIGEISSEKLFREEDISSILDNLYFSLNGLTSEGKPFTYKVKLNVKELL